MTTLTLRDETLINDLVRKIQSGLFDCFQLGFLLLLVREYANQPSILREVCDFTAHGKERNKGLATKSLIRMADAFALTYGYFSQTQTDLANGFPAQLYRALESQADVADETKLGEYGYSRSRLKDEIVKAFKIDANKKTYSSVSAVRTKKLLPVLNLLTRFIRVSEAFKVEEYIDELFILLTELQIELDQTALDGQREHIALATLFLINDVKFRLPDDEICTCEFGDSDINLTTAPTGLNLYGSVAGMTRHGYAINLRFALITSTLDPRKYCDESYFSRYENGDEKFQLQPPFKLSADWKLSPHTKCERQ